MKDLPCSRFIASWLDQDYQISTSKLKAKGWWALPIVDYINHMEAEWLCEAIRKLNIHEVVGISFEYKKPATKESVPLSEDAIQDYVFHNSYKTIILTSDMEDFLFFKDNRNRYFLLCGTKEFVATAYKCSEKAAEITYYDFIKDDKTKYKNHYLFMDSVWKKYSKLRELSE